MPLRRDGLGWGRLVAANAEGQSGIGATHRRWRCFISWEGWVGLAAAASAGGGGGFACPLSDASDKAGKQCVLLYLLPACSLRALGLPLVWRIPQVAYHILRQDLRQIQRALRIEAGVAASPEPAEATQLAAATEAGAGRSPPV